MAEIKATNPHLMDERHNHKVRVDDEETYQALLYLTDKMQFSSPSKLLQYLASGKAFLFLGDLEEVLRRQDQEQKMGHLTAKTRSIEQFQSLSLRKQKQLTDEIKKLGARSAKTIASAGQGVVGSVCKYVIRPYNRCSKGTCQEQDGPIRPNNTKTMQVVKKTVESDSGECHSAIAIMFWVITVECCTVVCLRW